MMINKTMIMTFLFEIIRYVIRMVLIYYSQESPSAASFMKYLDGPPSSAFFPSQLTHTAVSLPVQPTHRAV